jgi:hypothetical protein
MSADPIKRWWSPSEGADTLTGTLNLVESNYECK